MLLFNLEILITGDHPATGLGEGRGGGGKSEKQREMRWKASGTRNGRVGIPRGGSTWYALLINYQTLTFIMRFTDTKSLL